jgi:Cu2+-exporting ATPase
VPGVRSVRLASWSSDLVVDFDEHRLEADTLLAVLQHAVETRAGAEPPSARWQMMGKSATLGVAALTDFAIPALAPLSAALLVGTNLGTIAATVGDLRRRRLGMATIATAIIVGTLTTGQYLASGIMAWSFAFWRLRHRRDIEAERQLLLEDAVPLPACSLIDHADGTLTVQPVDTLASGDHVRLAPWDVVPADLLILEGRGVVDERCATGVPGVRAVAADDRVEAGAVVLGGRLVGTIASGREPRVMRAARLLATATQTQAGRFAPTRQAEEFVEQLAGPTLATAGIGLLVGDVTTAVAIMRPDYASAEAMAVSFEDIDAVACGVAAGCIVTAPRALDALAGVDTVVLVDHPALHERRLEVTRILPRPGRSADAELEPLRWAASLARHIADPRREALAALAADRGVILTDIVPDSFGDEAGLRIVHRRADRTLALVDTPGAGTAAPLVLHLDGGTWATFEFGPGLVRRACAALERMRDVRPLRAILAQPIDDGADDTLAAELHCEDSIGLGINAPSALVEAVRGLQAAGHRVAVVGPASLIAVSRGVAAVTVATGFDADSQGTDADIYSLSGDISCLGDLFAAAALRRRRLSLSRKMSIIPNVACIVGAFFFGFTSLVSAIVTNVGTLGTYRRASGTLHHNRRTHWLRNRASAASARIRLAAAPPRGDAP